MTSRSSRITNRDMAIHDLSKAAKELDQILKTPFVTYEEEAHIASHAQVYVIRAVVYALLDVADAIRQTPKAQ